MAGKRDRGWKYILHIYTEQDLEQMRVMVFELCRLRMEIRKNFLSRCRDYGEKKLTYQRKQQKSRLIISNSKFQ